MLHHQSELRDTNSGPRQTDQRGNRCLEDARMSMSTGYKLGFGPQDLLLDSLRMEKESMWLENWSCSKAERQRRWDLRVAEIRSILEPTSPHLFNLNSDIDQTNWPRVEPMQHSAAMARYQSDQPRRQRLDRNQNRSHGSAPMSRKRPSDLQNIEPSSATCGWPISPLTISSYQSSRNDPFSNYTLSSAPKAQRTSSGRKPLQQVPEIAVYDIEDYLRQSDFDNDPLQFDQVSFSNTPLFLQTATLGSMSPTAFSPLSSAFASSLPSSVTACSELTNATKSTSGMSRRSSHATNSLCGGLEMVKLSSHASNLSDFSIAEEHDAGLDKPSLGFGNKENSHLPTYCSASMIEKSNDKLHCLHGTQVPLSVTKLSSSLKTLTSEEEQPMQQPDFLDSYLSLPATDMRLHREQVSHGKRLLAPKFPQHQPAMSEHSSASEHRLMKIESSDGSVKEKISITKQPYNRPLRKKIRCHLCDEKPDGFRGEHELRRHVERAHSSMRKVWICVDSSPDKKFLANCKNCSQQKPYHAYYNAAAHLRRVHFNPKPKGRKCNGKLDAKRGGKGGGDEPPMEVLKTWMLEVEELSLDTFESGSFDRFFDDDAVMNINAAAVSNGLGKYDPHAAVPISPQTSNAQATSSIRIQNHNLELARHQLGNHVSKHSADHCQRGYSTALSLKGTTSFSDIMFDIDFSSNDHTTSIFDEYAHSVFDDTL